MTPMGLWTVGGTLVTVAVWSQAGPSAAFMAAGGLLLMAAVGRGLS